MSDPGYTPKPGSVPDRAIRFLREHGPHRQTALARGIGAMTTELHGACRSARTHGAIRFEGGLWSAPAETGQ